MRFVTLFLVSILLSFSGFGKQRSILKIRFSDERPIVVTIDGRNYNRYGKQIVFNDLPRGWHDLRVYEYKEYSDGTGGNAKVFYTGRVKVKKGEIVTCIIDVNTRKMKAFVQDIDAAVNNMPNTIASSDGMTNVELSNLGRNVLTLKTDTKKLELLKKELQAKKYTKEQLVAMFDWLSFESSRLDLAKWSYSRIIDKENYIYVADLFEYESTKEDFNKYRLQYR